MPSFKYSAVGPDGRTIKGTLDAPSQGECLEQLRNRSLMPLRVEEKSGKSKSAAASPSEWIRTELKL